jgi:hypothetical protein
VPTSRLAQPEKHLVNGYASSFGTPHRSTGHHAALRQLDNRLVGILHGCLKTGTPYDENIAWTHHPQQDQRAAA